MAKKFIAVNISNQGFCAKGIYLLNESGRFDDYEVIDSNNVQNIKPPFKLVLRTKVTLNGKYVERKKTYSFKAPSTFSSAVKKITLEKDSFREEVITPQVIEASVEEIVAAIKAESQFHITLGEYWKNNYVPYKLSTVKAKQRWRESTRNSMESFYEVWIKTSILNNMRLIDIKEMHVEGLISQVKSQRSLRTAKKVVEALSPLFKRFYKENKINELNPAEIDVGDLNNIREVVVSISEAKRLYDTMLNYPIPKYRHVFTFLATGRRLNEVLSLSISDVDVERGLFDIHQDHSKSGKRLTFVLRSEMMESLEDKVGLIHPSEKGTVMDGATIRHHWNKVLETAKLSDLHIHDLRHIITTILRDSGVTEEVSALVLGHTRSSITARYASANAQLANDVYQFFLDKLNGIIESTVKWVDV
jgi:integrase